MVTSFLWTRPADPQIATLVLAHGAGAPMDSPFMNRLAAALCAHQIAVARFEFPYMAQRRTGGSKRPPPRADKLAGVFQTAVQDAMAEIDGPLLIGGKSMGGRVAAMLSGSSSLPSRVAGVACFGYPFHPSGKGDTEWRLAPILEARRSVLILQGERDPFGSRAELEGTSLPAHAEITFVEDGDHDFGPRGKSPATLEGNITAAARTTGQFAERLATSGSEIVSSLT